MENFVCTVASCLRADSSPPLGGCILWALTHLPEQCGTESSAHVFAPHCRVVFHNIACGTSRTRGLAVDAYPPAVAALRRTVQ